MRLATGPVTWGVDFAGDPANPPWEQVLDEIVVSPLDALELGPVGYLPEEPGELRGALLGRGLTAVGSFVFDDFHDPGRRDVVLAASERAARAIAAAGGSVLVIIDKPCPDRVATAGRPGAAPRLAPDAWALMLAAIEGAAEIGLAAGLRPAFHPHAGTYLEFGDEIERLLADSDLGLCLDTGHLVYADVDAAALVTAHPERIAHVHLKDVDGAVLARVRETGADFWAAIADGVFCPLGAGVAPLGPSLQALAANGYDGFMTIEQDRVPGQGSPLGDLRASVEYLRGLV